MSDRIRKIQLIRDTAANLDIAQLNSSADAAFWIIGVLESGDAELTDAIESLLTEARKRAAKLSGAPVEWHDDRPDGHPDMHTSTQPGDLDTFGRPLRPGS